MGLEPPAAQERGYERSDESTDIDEYVEDLEAGVTLSLRFLKSFRTFLRCLGLEIVVQLTDHGLQVSLEQTVAECY